MVDHAEIQCSRACFEQYPDIVKGRVSLKAALFPCKGSFTYSDCDYESDFAKNRFIAFLYNYSDLAKVNIKQKSNVAIANAIAQRE